MSADDKDGVGRAAEVLSVYQQIVCNYFGLQETRSSGRSALLLQARCEVYRSCEPGGDGEGKKGQDGVRFAVRKSMSRAETRSSEFISGMLLKVMREKCGPAQLVTFVVGYEPIDTQYVGKMHAFWTVLDRAVKKVPEHKQLFVLMGENARTGRRRSGKLGSEEFKVLGAYGRDTLNDNGE